MPYGHHRLRIGRASAPGRLYLITFCTQARRPLFEVPAVAEAGVSILGDPAQWPQASLLAWVLMPDHWHCLIRLEHEAGVSQVVGHAKGGSAYRLGHRFPHLRPIWQPAFHDHALRRDEDAPACVRYLLDNPVRAGLVADAGRYPYRGGPWADACLHHHSR